MIPIPLTNTSDLTTVDATPRSLGDAGAVAMDPTQRYMFVSTTNCFIRQGTCKLVTCVAKANLVDTDFIAISIGVGGTTVTYEFDTAGNGVTAGRVQVNVSADTTAATVAARLRTAILASQPALEVTDNGNGTLTIMAPDLTMAITETVADAGFLVAAAVPTVTAGDKSMLVPASFVVYRSGRQGEHLGVIQATVAGQASLTRYEVY